MIQEHYHKKFLKEQWKKFELNNKEKKVAIATKMK